MRNAQTNPTMLSDGTLTAVRAALRGKPVRIDELSPAEVAVLGFHGVAPLLYGLTRSPALRSAALREAALEQLREHDAREVLRLLSGAGIEAFILKGTALAYSLYESPHLRPRSDTDLLIRPESLDAARRAFTSAGFVEAVSSGDEHGLRQTLFTRSGPGGVVHSYDVHWAVTNTPLFSGVLEHDEIRRRAVPLPRLGTEARGLGDVDALLLACVHRIAHHHDSDRLIWLVDIALLRERMTREQHGEFWKLAAERDVVTVCSRSIELADELYARAATHRAEDFLPSGRLTQEERTAAFLNREITHGSVLLANLKALPWHQRFTRLMQLAFPPAAFIRSRFGVQSRVLLPLFYVVRGARSLAKLFRRAEP